MRESFNKSAKIVYAVVSTALILFLYFGAFTRSPDNEYEVDEEAQDKSMIEHLQTKGYVVIAPPEDDFGFIPFEQN